MEWILAIYIFTAGEWQLHEQHRFVDVESCIQAQWEFTAHNPAIDDTVHWQNMINKRTDAPLWNESKATQAEAMAANVQGDWAKCEELMAEALRMIKKTAGEYPTE